MRSTGKLSYLVDVKGLPTYSQRVVITDYIDCELLKDHNCLVYEVIEQCCVNGAPNTPRFVNSVERAKYLR